MGRRNGKNNPILPPELQNITYATLTWLGLGMGRQRPSKRTRISIGITLIIRARARENFAYETPPDGVWPEHGQVLPPRDEAWDGHGKAAS